MPRTPLHLLARLRDQATRVEDLEDQLAAARRTSPALLILLLAAAAQRAVADAARARAQLEEVREYARRLEIVLAVGRYALDAQDLRQLVPAPRRPLRPAVRP